MQAAADEEQDHLMWCVQRIKELDGHTSYLNPLWYTGAWVIGAVAGAVGDRWSLGFVAETEKQVVAHLQSHLNRIAPQDHKTRTILEKMAEEEAHHASVAMSAGGVPLPKPIQHLMRFSAKIMTTTAYYV
jgi:ubiquinone biosynthesis monooxygenase Coq7